MASPSDRSRRLYRKATLLGDELAVLREQLAPLQARLLTLQEDARKAFSDMNGSFVQDGIEPMEGYRALQAEAASHRARRTRAPPTGSRPPAEDEPVNPATVTYHALEGATGIPGLAMTWTTPAGEIRWVAALDREREGRLTEGGRVPQGTDPLSAIVAAVSAPPAALAMLSESDSFALLMPHVSAREGAAFVGLPPVREQAPSAAEALSRAGLPPRMRVALQACLDHGAPPGWLPRWSRPPGSDPWDALAIAAAFRPVIANPGGAKASIAPDVMEAVSRRWPAATDAHLRRLSCTDCPSGVAVRSEDPGVAHASLTLLLGSPVDWWPGIEAWPAFNVCARAIHALGMATGTDPVVLARASRGDWDAFAERLARAAGGGARILGQCQSARDPVHSLLSTLLLPLAASRADEGTLLRMDADARRWRSSATGASGTELLHPMLAARALLCDGRSAPRVLEMSVEWHARQDLMQATFAGRGGGASWPPLFEGEYRTGDLGIVAVADYGSLLAEGTGGTGVDGVAGLDHCVATRLPAVLEGYCHILSVRRHAPDGTWARVSTCEVTATPSDGPGPEVHAIEHQGLRNSPPSREAVEAVSRLVRTMRVGKLKANPEALLVRSSPGDLDAVATGCGYNWRDPGCRDAALRAWEPLLPRWARGLDEEGFLSALSERGLSPLPQPAPPHGHDTVAEPSEDEGAEPCLTP